jgi:endoglucanase
VISAPDYPGGVLSMGVSHLAVDPPRRRWWIVGGIAALILAVVAVTVGLTRGGSEADPAAGPSNGPGDGPSAGRTSATSAPASSAAGSAGSTAPTSGAPRRLKAPHRPRLQGRPTVGATVVARVPPAWPDDVALSYQWLADGTPVAGATAKTYRPQRALVGARLAVRVTGSRPGYQQVTKTSAAATVLPDNPLAGGRWGVYRGPWNGIYPAYQRAGGATKALLGRIALQPRMIWFAANLPTSRVGADVRDVIAQQQDGDPHTLVQLAVFRQWPREESGRGTPLSRAEQQDYRAWVDQVAAAIGDARVAMVLEPDLGLDAVPNNPRDRRTADPATRLGLVRYAAQRFGALENTAVYLDASDADWLSVAKEVPLLEAAGIEYVRGIALGATHYSSVADNIEYGASLVRALARAGYPDVHIVIDTADNGRPFTWAQYYAKHPHGDFDNAEPCRSTSETQCDTLGIPPTTHVTDPRLGLTDEQTRDAQLFVDAYLWFGRPWLVRQASPFSLSRSLQVARTTPFQ